MSQALLMIEDDERLARMVGEYLGNSGFVVHHAGNAQAGLAHLQAPGPQAPQLIILDLMLPKMPGLEVCRALKTDPATGNIPILMLTAKAEEVDRIVGFELGADDYMTKPFSPRELVLRIQSVLRRAAGQPEESAAIKLGGIVVDRTRHAVTVKGKAVELTAIEFKLLATLMERRGRVQSRDVLLNDVWSYDAAIDTRTVDTHVRRLREKLGKASNCVETVRGFGYRMVDVS